MSGFRRRYDCVFLSIGLQRLCGTARLLFISSESFKQLTMDEAIAALRSVVRADADPSALFNDECQQHLNTAADTAQQLLSQQSTISKADLGRLRSLYEVMLQYVERLFAVWSTVVMGDSAAAILRKLAFAQMSVTLLASLHGSSDRLRFSKDAFPSSIRSLLKRGSPVPNRLLRAVVIESLSDWSILKEDCTTFVLEMIKTGVEENLWTQSVDRWGTKIYHALDQCLKVSGEARRWVRFVEGFLHYMPPLAWCDLNDTDIKIYLMHVVLAYIAFAMESDVGLREAFRSNWHNRVLPVQWADKALRPVDDDCGAMAFLVSAPLLVIATSAPTWLDPTDTKDQIDWPSYNVFRFMLQYPLSVVENTFAKGTSLDAP